MDSIVLTDDQKVFLHWIRERENARVNKTQGKPKPWTEDPIIQQYRFCNVEREKDTVSQWIHSNWCEPNVDHPNLVFAMVVARLFNWPPTLERLGFPLRSFLEDKELWRMRLKGIRDIDKGKVFTGAYLVSTNGVKMDKIDYILDRVLTPIWNRCPRPKEGETLQSFWNKLTIFDGLGSFMAGQVIADLKYFDPILKNASDWWTWAPLGPGSKRGLNRFYGRPVEKGLNQENALKELQYLRILVQSELAWNLPVHNIQNCCCEYDKYLRVRNNEGTPRSRYQGAY